MMQKQQDALNALNQTLRDRKEVGRGNAGFFTVDYWVIADAFPDAQGRPDDDKLQAWCKENGLYGSLNRSSRFFHFHTK